MQVKFLFLPGKMKKFWLTLNLFSKSRKLVPMNLFEKVCRLPKMVLFVLAILFCIFVSSAYAQQPPLDSLLRKVRYQSEDTLKAKLYYDIGINYYSKDKS